MSANKIFPIVLVRFYYQDLLLQVHSLRLQVEKVIQTPNINLKIPITLKFYVVFYEEHIANDQ